MLMSSLQIGNLTATVVRARISYQNLIAANDMPNRAGVHHIRLAVF